MRKSLFIIPALALFPKISLAHCPLCTAGAGALAVLAAYLGVSSVVVGVLIGAFALALSLWLSKMVKKDYIPYQKFFLVIIIFLGTVWPIAPLIQHYAPFYVPFMGQYGKTYAINLYVLGVIIGSAIMIISPYLSKTLTKLRGKQISYQGISITISLLIIISVIIQLLS